MVDGCQHPPNGSLLTLRDVQRLHGAAELGKGSLRLLLVFRLRKEGREEEAMRVEKRRSSNSGLAVGGTCDCFISTVNHPQLGCAKMTLRAPNAEKVLEIASI